MKTNYHKKCLKRVVQLAMVYSVLFFCTSCVNTISDTDSGEELQTSNLTFRVSPYSLSPMTRATTATLALKTICAALYMQDSSSNWVKKYDTSVTANPSGTTTISFPSVVHGTYKLVIIGHTLDNTANPNMTDITAITFPNNKIPEFQYNTTDVTVSPSTTNDGNVSLELGVAKLVIDVSNYEELKDYKLALQVDGTATAFNALTGFGKEVVSRTGELNLSQITSLKVIYNLLLMQQEETADASSINVTLQAKASDGSVVSTETLNKVHAQIGYVTTYQGNLFDSTVGDFNITYQNNYTGEYTESL